MKDSVTQEKLAAPVDYIESQKCKIKTSDGYLAFVDNELTVNDTGEVFDLINNGDGTYSFKTTNNYYWRCNTDKLDAPIDNLSNSSFPSIS